MVNSNRIFQLNFMHNIFRLHFIDEVVNSFERCDLGREVEDFEFMKRLKGFDFW